MGHRVETAAFVAGSFGNPRNVVVAGGLVRQSRHGGRQRDWSSREPNQLLHRTRPSMLICAAHRENVYAVACAAVPVSVLFGD